MIAPNKYDTNFLLFFYSVFHVAPLRDCGAAQILRDFLVKDYGYRAWFRVKIRIRVRVRGRVKGIGYGV